MAIVIAVSKSPTHSFVKKNYESISLIKEFGIDGDAHAGKLVKHQYDVRKTPNKPNLRQVHLIHSELHEELKEKGFNIKPGEMGENITTQGIDILNLPKGTILKIGGASIEITGLREPCSLLNSLGKGLMKATIEKRENGEIIRKAGIMSIVLESGEIKVGDKIEVILPEKPHQKLQTV